MSNRATASAAAATAVKLTTAPARMLQRTCACGQHTASGECEECHQRNDGILQRAAIAAWPGEETLPLVHEAVPVPRGQPLAALEEDRDARRDFTRVNVTAPSFPRRTGIQQKLIVNRPGDVYEQEADRVASHVMRMPDPSPAIENRLDEPGVQRLCRQSNDNGSSDSGLTAAPPTVHEAWGSSGQPLNPATRAFMEPRFGHDFSRVRVHTGARASESAQAVQARAYTVGRDIVFDSGAYAPDTPRGERLLAHELTHVAQQGAVRSAVLQRRPATGTATSAPAYTEPGWKIINKPGIVRVEEAKAKERGARLRPEPNTSPASTAESVHLDENTHLVVVAANPASNWSYVHVTEGAYIAHAGYVASWLLHTNLPDPAAIEYYIDKPGLRLQWLVENHPYFKDYDIKTGDDARTLVMAVYKANEEHPIEQKKAGVYLNPEKLAEAKDAGFWTSVGDRLDEYRRVMRPILQSIELKLHHKIWLPGPAYIDSLKDKGVIPERPAWKNALVKVTKGIGGFVSGLVQGFIGSFVDLFVGVYDFVKTIISTVKDLFSGELFDKAQKIYDAIVQFLESKTPGEVLSTIVNALSTAIGEMWTSFTRRWSSNNFFDKWNFRGRVIGYIAAEILMAVFSGGASLAAKLLSKLGKVGKILAEILAKILNKVDDILDLVPGRKRSKHEASKHGDGKDSKSKQLPMAIAAASVTTEISDKADLPVPMALAALSAVRARYSWIKGFSSEPKGPGRYLILMNASRHVVDEDYTTKDETPDKPDASLGRNPPPTKEPVPNVPESGTAFEKRALANEPGPPSKTYFGWKGGTRDFHALEKAMRQHGTDFQTGVRLPRTRVLSQSAHQFIQGNRTLRRMWNQEVQSITDALQRVWKAKRKTAGDWRALKALQKQELELQKQLDEYLDFAKGEVGRKRLDLVQIDMDKNGISRVFVTDTTLKPRDPAHNFKTRFYVEVMKRLTGTNNVHGLDWKSLYDVTSVTPRAK